jgi:hypothetical protein
VVLRVRPAAGDQPAAGAAGQLKKLLDLIEQKKSNQQQ